MHGAQRGGEEKHAMESPRMKRAARMPSFDQMGPASPRSVGGARRRADFDDSIAAPSNAAGGAGASGSGARGFPVEALPSEELPPASDVTRAPTPASPPPRPPVSVAAETEQLPAPAPRRRESLAPLAMAAPSSADKKRCACAGDRGKTNWKAFGIVAVALALAYAAWRYMQQRGARGAPKAATASPQVPKPRCS